MARTLGRLTKIGIGRETTRGTVVPPLYWIPVLEQGFDDKIELKDNESGFGSVAAIQDSQVVKKWAEGEYTGKIFDRSVGLELTALFGALPVSTQRTTTGVYDNVYTLANTNSNISLTTALVDDNYSGRFALSVINSWSLEAEIGDYIKRTVNLISKSSTSSSETPAYTNENEFIPKHMIVKMAAAGAIDATIDAATAIKARSISLEMNKNAEDIQVFGSVDLDDVLTKQVEVTGEMEIYYDARTYHTLAAAGTHQALRIEMINTDIIVGTSGSHNPALRFTMREVALDYPEVSRGNNDISTVTVPFRAMLNLATGTLIEARLTNAVNGAVTY